MERKRFIQYTIAYLVCFGFLSWAVFVGNADDIIKYWAASGMSHGMKIYREINIIVPPLIYVIAAPLVAVFDSLLVIRMLNALVWTGVALSLHVVGQRLKISHKTIGFFNLAIGLYAYVSESFYYGYNMICLFFALVILSQLLKEELTGKSTIIIAVSSILMVWCKHTMGAVFFAMTVLVIWLKYRKQKRFWRKVGGMLVIDAGISAGFLGYLLSLGVMKNFLDVIFGGMSQFSNNYSKTFLFIDFAVIFGGVCFFAGYVIYAVKKQGGNLSELFETYREHCLVAFWGIGATLFVYPIFDAEHFTPMIVFFVLLLSLVNRSNEKLLFRISSLLFGTMVITSLTLGISNLSENNRLSSIPAFRGLPIQAGLEQNLLETEQIIKDADKKVYIIDKYAMIYSAAMRENHGYYDFLWLGNTGGKSPLHYVEELLKEDCLILMRTTSGQESQWDNSLGKYVKEHYQIRKDYGYWTLYE